MACTGKCAHVCVCVCKSYIMCFCMDSENVVLGKVGKTVSFDKLCHFCVRTVSIVRRKVCTHNIQCLGDAL